MDKNEVLKRVTALEAETKELRAIIEKADEPKPIMDRVKTFEDALAIYKALNGDSVDLSGTKDEIAYKKIKIIANVLNEGWSPNIQDTGENKYYPYFRVGSGFVYCAYAYGHTDTTYPSRLLYKSSKLAEYAGKKFTEIYKDLLN